MKIYKVIHTQIGKGMIHGCHVRAESPAKAVQNYQTNEDVPLTKPGDFFEVSVAGVSGSTIVFYTIITPCGTELVTEEQIRTTNAS